MCELLGMSANVPTDIRFSFAGLARRGGETGPHQDGWGISFYEGRGCRSFHDPEPSARSEIARLLRQYPIKSRIVIAHVRRANRGRVALEATKAEVGSAEKQIKFMEHVAHPTGVASFDPTVTAEARA